MGLMNTLMSALFGGGRNVVAETAEVFRVNAEAEAGRQADLRAAAMSQFDAEFRPSRGWFDQLIDGLNRLPRPLLAYGTLALFVMAMRDPEWFASRMQGIALVPEPLWWLMGAIVSFYFGARHQAKAQDFQRSVAESLSRLPQVRAARAAYEPDAPEAAPALPLLEASYQTGPNAALDEWRSAAH